MDYPIFELIINEDLNDDAEVSLVSLVDAPAIKKMFNKYADEEFVEGLPHYTKDGILWTGETHKDAEGRLMTGAIHTEDSEYLYHEGEFAEVGERGGIRRSDKAPNSKTKNDNPQGEGSAKGDASGKRGAKVTAEQEKTLENKVKDFNEKESNTKNGNATLGALKSVFQRGLGAYNTSHSPLVKSAEQWAYARVNAFLYLLKNGRPENAKYTTDYDLLPKDHPKAEKFAEDSYNDYPQEAINNAKRAVQYAEKNGWGTCGEATGKLRANQIANGENITRETIARISGFRRHQQNKNVPYDEGCGGLMWDAWGGDAMINWAEKKLRQIDKQNFVVQNEEKRIISGAIMLADSPIYRNDATNGEYYVVFTKDTIFKIVQKFFKKGFQSNVNLQHNAKDKVSNVTMFESFISDKDRGILPMKGFEDTPDGSWFGSFKVDDDNVWEMIKSGEIKGFSVEGIFEYTRKETKEEQVLKEIKKILSSISDK